MKQEIITLTAVILIIVIALCLLNIHEMITENNPYQISNHKKDGTEYNGIVSSSANINKKKITISIPEGFIDSGGKENYYIRKKDSQVIEPSMCILSIYVISNYQNAEHLAQGMASFNKTEQEKATINNQTWYTLMRKSTPNHFYYITDYYNEIVMAEIEYTNEDCLHTMQSAMETIHMK